jgi:hypothetical protein
MTGTIRLIVFCVVVGGLLGTEAAAAEESAQLNVIVRFSADVSARLTAEAEQSAGRVFDKARVRVRWRNCSARGGEFLDPACEGAPAPTDIVIQIVPRAERAQGAVLGMAFVSGCGGAYADIFLDRVQRIHDQDHKISMATLLGYAMAHEIGHLLLGEHSHSQEGLMVAEWRPDQLSKIAKGNLLFDSREASRLRTRLGELSAEDRLAFITSNSGN